MPVEQLIFINYPKNNIGHERTRLELGFIDKKVHNKLTAC